MRKFPIVMVEWLDAANYTRETSIDWLIKDAGGTVFLTVGHLLKSDSKQVVVAFEITDDNDARCTSVIHRGMVRKITRLHADSDKKPKDTGQ